MFHPPEELLCFIFVFQQPSTGDAGGDAYSGYSAISQADKQRQEPEKIRLWREEQKTMLEEKGQGH